MSLPFLFREEYVAWRQLYLSSNDCPFWGEGEEKEEGEPLTILEFSYKEKCAWKATFQSQELHGLQQFFQCYRIYRYVSLTVTFCRLQSPPHYQAGFPTINEAAVKFLNQITGTPSNTACRGAQHTCVLQQGEESELCFLYENKYSKTKETTFSLLPSELSQYNK